MGIEPTHQLFTGALVLKSIEWGHRYPFETRIITHNPLANKGFPVSRVLAGVGINRQDSYRHGHKIDIKLVHPPFVGPLLRPFGKQYISNMRW